MFNLLNIAANVQDTLVSPADSAKVFIKDMAEEIAKDPNKFVTDIIEQAIHFGLKLIAAIAIYLIGAWLIKRVKNLLKNVFIKRGTEPTLSTFIISVTSISLTVLLIIITIGALGINTTSFAAVLAAGGMAIGMALSGTVQNFAGGLMILLFKPFKVGDYIKTQGYEGTVFEVSIVSTKIKTVDNSIIILPNGSLCNGNIDNFSEKPYHRCQWNIGVAYGSDADKVREVLMDIVKNEPRILNSATEGASDPAVFLTSLNDSSVGFRLLGWVKIEDYWPVTFAINEKIYSELPKNGIEFPFPQMDVHVIKNS